MHNRKEHKTIKICGGMHRMIGNFLRQKVPAPGPVIPVYYRRALIAAGAVLSCYFAGVFVFLPLISGVFFWVPGLFFAAALFSVLTTDRRNILWNYLVCSLIIISWSCWGVYEFGWSFGLQHFIVVLLLFLFFNICIQPKWKMTICLLLLGLRMGLFAFSASVSPVFSLSHSGGIIFQTANSACFFLLVSLICIIFSSNIQNAERQLRLDNETLNKEAGTDPLTGLPNRREMIHIIEKFREESPQSSFCVAIADIDFFKHVNDTYGHACGDMTLVALTRLFGSTANGRYQACRWGGEEFCFFIPEKNIDEASVLMQDLNYAVEKMPLEYDGIPFFITITIGVEETDFRSSLDDLLASADEKLYLGKNSGRNRVVS